MALFHGRRFFLSGTVPPPQRARVRAAIEENGGEVTADAIGAIILVDQEHLSAETEWVAVDFVLDSVERGALQDLSNYMGTEVEPMQPVQSVQPQPQSRRDEAQVQAQQGGSGRRAKRMKYTKEDDARMLRFLQSRQLNKSMASVPVSVWAEAARQKVTLHSSQSMNERYRKQLRTKTPKERRQIIAHGLAEAQARTEETSDPIQDAEDGENPADNTSNNADTSGDNNAVDGEELEAPAVLAQEPSLRQEESNDEEIVAPSDQVSPIAKPSQRSTVQEAIASPDLPQARQRRHSSPVRTSELPTRRQEPSRRQSTGATHHSPVTRSTEHNRSKQALSPTTASRKRGRESESESESEDGDADGDESNQEGGQAPNANGADADRGVYFTSFWAKALEDSSTRRRLHNLFEPSQAPQSSAEPATPTQEQPEPNIQGQTPISSTASTPQTMRKRTLSESSRENEAAEETPQPTSAMFSSEHEMDLQIARIQFETRMDLPTVVHALYYASGDYAKTKAFLKGQSPAGIWSAEDDQLLGGLVSEETTRTEIEEAIQDGPLANMQVSHSAEEVLARIQYLL